MTDVTPNFFVIGAPKCGTTALTEYLRMHPRIFISQPKEPRFWCSDLKKNPNAERWAGAPENVDQYLKLFQGATPEHLAVGEGSTLYLFSTAAVPRILEFNPVARFIVMVREPVELFHSWHSYLVRQFQEEAECPERAWDLQAQRSEGASVPARCDIPDKLQYRRILALGSQLERLFQLVDREQVHVIFHEDFAANTAHEYARVLHFLGVPDDGRSEFPRVNEAFTYRFPWLARRILTPQRHLLSGLRWLKTHLPAPLAVRLRYRFLSMLRTGTEKPEMPNSLREIIAGELRDDVALLSQLLDRNLDHWMPSAKAPSRQSVSLSQT